MKSKYYKSSTRDYYKYDDGVESYFLQLTEGGFVIMEHEADIPMKEITEEEFKTAIINTGLVSTIKHLLG